jgi:hypothetical protein
MRRRDFIGIIYGAALALPCRAVAQQTGKVWRIGNVGTTTPDIGRIFAQTLEQGLADLGYVQGRNIVLLHRFPGAQMDKIEEAIMSLVPQIDLLVVWGNASIAAKKFSGEHADGLYIDRFPGGARARPKPRAPRRKHDRHNRRSRVGDKRKETADSQRNRTGPQASGCPSRRRYPILGS